MKKMIDIHVHLAALPDGDNGCIISEKMLNSGLFRSLIARLKLPMNDPAQTNATYVQRLVMNLKSSLYVQQAVILAMDGVYDSHGNLDRENTEFMISNEYVLEIAKQFPDQLLAGVSINPKRRDAIPALQHCVANGAALVKVLPNTQQFNPGDIAFKPFYRAMAQYKIPLLSHVGYEFSLVGKDQTMGDPGHLRLALEEGVTVIAAHGASFGLFIYEKYWDPKTEIGV